MPPNNNLFIESMIDLLDKLIDYQSKNAVLLSELKSSLNEIRSESSDILINLREKLPESLSKEQEENYRKLSNIIARIEDNNTRVHENIKVFEKNHQDIKSILDKNTQLLEKNTFILEKDNIMLISINDLVSKDKIKQEEMITTLKSVNSFIKSLKSKKAWVALIVAGVAAFATMISSVAGVLEKFQTPNDSSSTTFSPPKNIKKQ